MTLWVNFNCSPAIRRGCCPRGTEGGPVHRSFAPLDGSWHLGYKRKTPARGCGVLISTRSVWCCTRKERADPGQAGALWTVSQECSTCWELYVHVWKRLSNSVLADLSVAKPVPCAICQCLTQQSCFPSCFSFSLSLVFFFFFFACCFCSLTRGERIQQTPGPSSLLSPGRQGSPSHDAHQRWPGEQTRGVRSQEPVCQLHHGIGEQDPYHHGWTAGESGEGCLLSADWLSLLYTVMVKHVNN